MSVSFALKVITPEGVAYERSVVSVTLPTTSGEITILARHQPIITTIRSGELRVVDESGSVEPFFVTSGLASMHQDNSLVILIDYLETAHTINVDHAEMAYERARKLREEVIHVQDVDFARFEAMIERELGRVMVGRKYRALR